MLRDGGLRDPELRLNHFDDGAGLALAVGQQFEDAAADGISKDVERVHGLARAGAITSRVAIAPPVTPV